MNENVSWITDPALKDISQSKLNFLQQMLFESKKYKGKELFPFFMSLAARAKQENISFTQKELDLIIPVLKTYASSTDIEKMNKVITMFQSKK